MFMCPSSPRGGHDSTPAIAETRGSAPEQAGEHVAIAKAAARSEAALELAGLKRAAPEQGSSGHPMKKAQVLSKM
jgi:hypothetical protein